MKAKLDKSDREGGISPMPNKICPLKFSQPLERGAYDQEVSSSCECEEHACAWWVTPYTIEGRMTEGMCAIEMIAMKAPAEYQV